MADRGATPTAVSNERIASPKLSGSPDVKAAARAVAPPSVQPVHAGLGRHAPSFLFRVLRED